jgi:hypothetical protein
MSFDPKAFLENAGLDPDSPLLEHPTLAEAVESLAATLENYCPDLDVEELAAEDWLALLAAYRETVLKHRPENETQERAALMSAWEVLERHGLDDDDFMGLDFRDLEEY